VERYIYEHSLQHHAEDEPAETPEVVPYVAAWVCYLGCVAACVAYVLRAGSRMGNGDSRLWLQDCCVSLVLYYGIIAVLEVLFFGLVMPGLLKQHFEKYADPTSLARFPFETKLPGVATFFVAVWNADDLGGTRIGRYCLGEDLESTAAAPVDVEAVYRDATWRPSLGVRVAIYASSFLVALPISWQEVLFEEVFSAAPLVSKLLLLAGVDVANGGSSRGRRAVDVSTIVNLAGLVVFIVLFVAAWIGAARCLSAYGAWRAARRRDGDDGDEWDAGAPRWSEAGGENIVDLLKETAANVHRARRASRLAAAGAADLEVELGKIGDADAPDAEAPPGDSKAPDDGDGAPRRTVRFADPGEPATVRLADEPELDRPPKVRGSVAPDLGALYGSGEEAAEPCAYNPLSASHARAGSIAVSFADGFGPRASVVACAAENPLSASHARQGSIAVSFADGFGPRASVVAGAAENPLSASHARQRSLAPNLANVFARQDSDLS